MAELFFSVDDFVGFFFRSIALLVLVSPPHQVRTAADTASEDYSCGHRRCWTAAASKGLLSLVCVVVVLVAMRFASYTLAFDGHVGRSRVLNPAPLYFFRYIPPK